MVPASGCDQGLRAKCRASATRYRMRSRDTGWGAHLPRGTAAWGGRPGTWRRWAPPPPPTAAGGSGLAGPSSRRTRRTSACSSPRHPACRDTPARAQPEAWTPSQPAPPQPTLLLLPDPPHPLTHESLSPSHTDTVLGTQVAEAPIWHPKVMALPGEGSPGTRDRAIRGGGGSCACLTQPGRDEAGPGLTAHC